MGPADDVIAAAESILLDAHADEIAAHLRLLSAKLLELADDLEGGGS